MAQLRDRPVLFPLMTLWSKPSGAPGSDRGSAQGCHSGGTTTEQPVEVVLRPKNLTDIHTYVHTDFHMDGLTDGEVICRFFRVIQDSLCKAFVFSFEIKLNISLFCGTREQLKGLSPIF